MPTPYSHPLRRFKRYLAPRYHLVSLCVIPGISLSSRAFFVIPGVFCHPERQRRISRPGIEILRFAQNDISKPESFVPVADAHGASKRSRKRFTGSFVPGTLALGARIRARRKLTESFVPGTLALGARIRARRGLTESSAHMCSLLVRRLLCSLRQPHLLGTAGKHVLSASPGPFSLS